MSPETHVFRTGCCSRRASRSRSSVSCLLVVPPPPRPDPGVNDFHKQNRARALDFAPQNSRRASAAAGDVAWSAVPQFQTSPGMRDVRSPESERARRLVDTFAAVVEAAGYRQLVTPLLEDVGRVQPCRRGHRHRAEGDVPLHRHRRARGGVTAGVHGVGMPCVRAASAGDTVEGLVGRSELPLRAPQARSLSPVRPGQPRGAR